jgi:alpha-ketoglutaric semialdehyde dehydrogenase
VRCLGREDVLEAARALQGHLTATVHGTPNDLDEYGDLLSILATKAGRVIVSGMPTGVEVSPAMHHGGPWPAATDPRATSVGTAAILRFARPVCYQNVPEGALPEPIQSANPRKLWRLVDGQRTREGL